MGLAVLEDLVRWLVRTNGPQRSVQAWMNRSIASTRSGPESNLPRRIA